VVRKKRAARKLAKSGKSSKTGSGMQATGAAKRKGRNATASAPVAGGSAMAEPVRIARVPKGKRPQYFSDPATDKLLSITLTLCEELSVARDRLDTLERLLEQRRVLKVSDVDAYIPSGEIETQRERRRAQYIDRVLRAVQAELEEVTGKGPKSQEEIIAAVEN
jgi:hypothetical protein